MEMPKIIQLTLLVKKAVAWPGTQKSSYRTGSGVILAAGYVVYNVLPCIRGCVMTVPPLNEAKGVILST